MNARSNAAPVIIKRKKVVGSGGHHGGAWKVAIALTFVFGGFRRFHIPPRSHGNGLSCLSDMCSERGVLRLRHPIADAGTRWTAKS